VKEGDLKLIKITLADGRKIDVPEGTMLLDLSKDFANEYRALIVAAKVDNDIKELTYRLEEPCSVEFIDLTDEDGMRIYRRSLHFLLIKAAHDLFPDRKVIIDHSISKGIYCEIIGKKELTSDEVKRLEQRMAELVEAKIPFIKREVPIDEAREIFIKNNRMDRFQIIEHRKKPYVTMYRCDDLDDYFYGYMVPDTGYLKVFSLKYYPPGLIMLFPEKSNPDVLPEFEEQKKLFNVFSEYTRWGRILGVDTVGELNNIVASGRIGDLIRVSEAIHEKKIAQIADMITGSSHKKRVVLISGPSSSGKTTFAQRLSIQLRVNGVRPVTISLDDYFVDREHTPRDEKGELDFEALESIDVELFNLHLASLISGLEVEVPIFDFPTGRRGNVGRKLKIEEDQILIIEGIHGLNEKLTSTIKREDKFKIYVSALTSMNIDDHNRIPTTDARFIRRIVRDYQFRASSAEDTIKRWPSVRRGETRNIFPFQEEADVMFNSSLIYELGVLKVFAEPLLSKIDRSCREYSEAKRLLEFLGNFLPIDHKEIPNNSIIREFIGGSVFYGM